MNSSCPSAVRSSRTWYPVVPRAGMQRWLQGCWVPVRVRRGQERDKPSESPRRAAGCNGPSWGAHPSSCKLTVPGDTLCVSTRAAQIPRPQCPLLQCPQTRSGCAPTPKQLLQPHFPGFAQKKLPQRKDGGTWRFCPCLCHVLGSLRTKKQRRNGRHYSNDGDKFN